MRRANLSFDRKRNYSYLIQKYVITLAIVRRGWRNISALSGWVDPGHRLLILINILEINQSFSFSKNIDFCIDFAIDFGIDSETAKFDQIWLNLIKFRLILIKFDQICSSLIKSDQVWSSLIKLHFLSFVPCLLIFHTFPCWFSIEKARLEINKNYWFLFENIN